MNKISLLLLFIVSASTIYAQGESPWKRISRDQTVISDKNSARLNLGKQLFFQLDETALKKSLTTIHDKRVEKTGVEISLPNSNGVLEKFLVWESSNFEPQLQAKYPEIRAYAGIGITDRKASLNFSFSPNGIQTMILRGDSGSEFIERYSKDKSIYVVFDSKNREMGSLPFSCTTEDIALNRQLLNKTSGVKANNQVFKTLRLALSCTGEYAVFHGGTVAGALAGMNATMTRVNGIFNKDLAVKLIIIANDNLIIYTNAATDPYSPATAGAGGEWNKELQTNLTTTIGEINYDIGHLFGASGGGGNSGCIGCVCVSPTADEPLGKGSAFTSPADGIPQGDTFDIDFVVHEMGHQLGANHTFSYALEGTGVNVEPGSGSTIMGYAGITEYDIQASSDDYFAYVSILQIQNNLATKSCPVNTAITNSPPVIIAGPDWNIPKGTAFKLTGSGSDPNGDTITYCWEENDTATTQSDSNSIAFPTKIDGPLFRSIYPSASPVRYMPAFSDVISNRLSGRWESVSDIARTLHFTLTGRDNSALGTAQTNTDTMILAVSGTVGPFAITSQNTSDVGWPIGSSQTISWSVNGSNVLTGSANVNIKLSTDGGLSFPTVLASNTPNDGSQIITVHDVAATNCRLLIEPTANIYYAVNKVPFAIGYSVVAVCTSYTFPGTPFAIPEQAAYTPVTISAPASTATISDVNLSVGFTHSYMSDLQIDVLGPSGTTVKLLERSCGETNSSLFLNYDDVGGVLSCGSTTAQTVAPFEPLSAFNGQNPQGIWTLRVRDAFTNDPGTLDSATITICTKTYTISAPSLETGDLTVYSNPNNGNFNVQFVSNFASDIQVLVHDLLGKKVYEQNFKKSEFFNENIQMENVQPGVYLVTVMNGVRVGVKKIIVK